VLDEEVKTFLARPIDGEHPYVWLDATFHKVREAGRVISIATVVAIGVDEHGQRRILGVKAERARTISSGPRSFASSSSEG
jgi:putative transposase